MMKSKRFCCFSIASSSFEMTTPLAPSRFASSDLPGEVVKSVTSAPKALGKFERHVSKAAESNYSDFLTFAHFPFAQRRIGRYPGTQKGAAAAGSSLSETRSTKS
jgi:hypothetical protein